MLEHYRQRFQHILVDEYQDTNQAQNEIVLLLAGGHHNVCVVGDTDQCLPPGTLVSTPRRTVPIEAIAVGDVVLGAAGGTDDASGIGSRTFTRAATTVSSFDVASMAGRSPAHAAPPRPRPARPTTGPSPRLPDVPRRPGLPGRPHDQSASTGRRARSRARASSSDATRSTPMRLWILQVCDIAGRGRVLRGLLRRRVRPAHGVLPRRRARASQWTTRWLQRLYDDRSTPRHGRSG